MSKAGLVVGVGVCVIMSLLTVFALELADTQAKSKVDIRHQVHDRSVLAGGLIDSLFQSVQQTIPQDSQAYGASLVPTSRLDAAAAASQDTYLALLGADDEVLASSSGFNSQARADLGRSAALMLVHSGHVYGLGNLLPYGKSGVINLAVSFPTAYGTRVLLTGLDPQGALNGFITRELATIPGVKGSRNYLLDANNVVLASTNPAKPVGSTVSPAGTAALKHASGDVSGRYFDQATLANSTWRIVLSAPNGALFATVSGARRLVPWLIFAAFALVALVALALGWRVVRSAGVLAELNAKLGRVNDELTGANAALECRAVELARSNQELDEFASIASHDLQEPLRKVRTFTELLNVLEAERLSEKGRDYLVRADSAAERMQMLIEGLLKFSRVSTQGRPFTAVDLARVAREVLSDLDAQVLDSDAVVRVGELPTISADALQMQQLIQNLVSNSLKFRREGVAPEIDVEASFDGGEVHLVVRDNGIGFEARYSGRIFRVFERLHGRGEYPGTGIGLALCRKIADRHGGTITAESEPGVGSTFTVTLPIAQTDESGPSTDAPGVDSGIDLQEAHSNA